MHPYFLHNKDAVVLMCWDVVASAGFGKLRVSCIIYWVLVRVVCKIVESFYVLVDMGAHVQKVARLQMETSSGLLPSLILGDLRRTPHPVIVV